MTFHSFRRALGAWSSLAGGGTAEILAAAGPDWLVLDAQHGTYDDAGLRATIATLGTAKDRAPVWVRMPDDAASGIGRALDAGADGVVVPLVDTAEQAERVAMACRYPPLGGRSWGPMGALTGRPAPTPTAANAAVTCAVMVETQTAVAHVDEIAAVAGVDMIFVGPFDLAMAFGTTIEELLTESGGGVLDRIVAACTTHGVRAGAFAGTAERAALLFDRGFTDVAVCTDAGLLATAAAAQLAHWRGSDVDVARSAGY
jgi:4-hydroxy-2-oxoheptanedioate aldolase